MSVDITAGPPQKVIVESVRTVGGGEGGATNSLLERKFTIAFNTGGILTGAALWTPSVGDTIYDFWLRFAGPWDGLTPQLDLVTGTGKGVLASLGLPPLPLWAGDADLGGGAAGLVGAPTMTSMSAAALSAALNGGTPTKHQVTVGTANPVMAAVSQDGSTNAAVAATLTAASAPSLPLTVGSSTNQFAYLGSDPTGGGGGAAPELFTIANGTYSTIAALVTAVAAATGAVSGEAFSTKCSVTNSSGSIKLTMATAGAAGEGNQIQATTHDVSAGLGFGVPSIFAGGAGGDPGSTTGIAILTVLTGSPA